MSLSNYPPGVTGNEYEIAGPDWEETVYRSCDSQKEFVIWPHEVNIILEQISKLEDSPQKFYHLPELTTKLVQALRFGEASSVDSPCPFEGDVDAQGYGHTILWTCPLCNTDHEDNNDN
jgi:hypothetical protein